ncbi:nucleotide-diphospho-sugar transferase [Aureobasidium sp. EXF-3400]|nr:nucleotide-diphospho-sugar transferase [Aureobasidium sp. EXF-12344]KAI4781892.1 nucleotide-diphospho-sugar transferase [Aureobasidium sp. EXF-3400]
MLDTSILGLTEPGIDSSLTYDTTIPSNVDWSKYAYIPYVTSPTYLCNSIMIFESLHRLGSKAERLMMYPEEWAVNSESPDAGLLRKARDKYKVDLQPVQIQRLGEDITWSESFTKLLAFNQTQFDRVISLDSDANVLQSMDELFFVPQASIAMPRVYWLDGTLSSQLMVIQPFQTDFERVNQAVIARNATDFDMEIVNDLYGDECLVLPYQKYNLITGEFRNNLHHRYLGSVTDRWDARRALKEAKYLHFSDWPYPKPWSEYSHIMHDEWQPACEITLEGEEDCSSRDVWDELYDEFLSRRQRVCGSRYMPD